MRHLTAVLLLAAAPARNGAAVTDKDEIQKSMLMHTLLGAAGQGADARPPAKSNWCAEGPIAGTEVPMLLWRAVFDDGSDASADRLTPVTMGDPLALMSDPDAVEALSSDAKPGDNAPRWLVSLQNGKKTWLFAVYSGRPPAASLGALMQSIIDRKAKALGGFSVDGKSVTIDMPGSN